MFEVLSVGVIFGLEEDYRRGEKALACGTGAEGVGGGLYSKSLLSLFTADDDL